MIIMIVLTGLTLVSSETASVKPKAPAGGWLTFFSYYF
jgi:hypothetical protein